VSNYLISLQNAGYRIGERWLWRGLSFAAAAGDIVAVAGPNGCGKTTLSRVMTRLAPLTEGQWHAPHAVGYVPQISELHSPFTVEQVVHMGHARTASAFGWLRESDTEKTRAAIAAVGLTAFAQQSFLRLSGGERQLTLIARALAQDTRVLVLDEPLAALDLANQARMLDRFTTLAAQGYAIVFTTHQPQHALRCASHALLLRCGEPPVFGPAGRVIADAPLSQIYGVPVQVMALDGPDGVSRHVIPFV
jgi:iron complex transport system ATP-binding protein